MYRLYARTEYARGTKTVILCVVAHLDDEVFLGASIARFAFKGHRVYVLALADGVGSRLPIGTSIGCAERVREDQAKQAAHVLGYRLHLVEPMYRDQRLDSVPLLEITQRIEASMCELRPSVVYTHSPGDLNADHRRVYEAVLPAVRPKSGVTAVYSFAGPRMLAFHPTSFVAVTEAQIARQVTAAKCYGDELAGDLDLMKARAVECGHRVGVPYAEGFETVGVLI